MTQQRLAQKFAAGLKGDEGVVEPPVLWRGSSDEGAVTCTCLFIWGLGCSLEAPESSPLARPHHAEAGRELRGRGQDSSGRGTSCPVHTFVPAPGNTVRTLYTPELVPVSNRLCTARAPCAGCGRGRPRPFPRPTPESFGSATGSHAGRSDFVETLRQPETNPRRPWPRLRRAGAGTREKC